jgi:5-(carboxyamino)imidazole ribonucleotide mutase
MEVTGGRVAIVMGSQSDWPTMKTAAEVLDELEVPYEARITSAHRTPDRMVAFAKGAEGEGFDVIIAGAGGAAHLPGMIASMTHLPVLGVPVQSKALSGMDSLLSIVQMPGGIPVGTLAIGEAGAKNAGLLAARSSLCRTRTCPNACRTGAPPRAPPWPRCRKTDAARRLHHRHSGRRPAGPDDGDGRAPARLPLHRLCSAGR